MTKTLLVTGGCGFIGANFVRHMLAKVPEVRIVNLDKLTYAGNLANLADISGNPRYRFVHGDICDAPLVERLFAHENPDVVVHFAAESHVDRSIYGPGTFVQTNVVGTFVLLEAARKTWINGHKKDSSRRFLHISTDEVFGSLGVSGFLPKRPLTTPVLPIRPARLPLIIWSAPISIPTACPRSSPTAPTTTDRTSFPKN